MQPDYVNTLIREGGKLAVLTVATCVLEQALAKVEE